MVTLFSFALDTVFTVKNSSSLIDSCLFVSAFPSTSCCGSPVLLVTFSVPCVKGVTCDSQNVTGLPFRLNDLADLSLHGFRMFGSIWFSFIFTFSIISVFIESVLPFQSSLLGFSALLDIGFRMVAFIGLLALFQFIIFFLSNKVVRFVPSIAT